MRIWWAAMFVAACAHGGSGGSASFSIAYPGARPGKVGKKYYAPATGQCHYDNGRDAHWAITGARVASGELPAGVTIEDGAITGTPTKPGDYHAQVVITGVTCAGKPETDQTIDVAISIAR
jgi:hypothetical protein